MSRYKSMEQINTSQLCSLELILPYFKTNLSQGNKCFGPTFWYWCL